VQHVADIVANANVFADKWGWWPMRSWLDQFHDRGLVRRGINGRWEVTESEGAPVACPLPRCSARAAHLWVR
jgi:hypothetical protein